LRMASRHLCELGFQAGCCAKAYLWAEGVSLQEFESQLLCPTLQMKLVLLLCLFISGYGQTF